MQLNDVNISVVYKDMNEIFYKICDEYGYDNQPYEYANNNTYNKRTIKIEIPMWRYDKKFIKNVFEEFGIDINFDNVDSNTSIFLNS